MDLLVWCSDSWKLSKTTRGTIAMVMITKDMTGRVTAVVVSIDKGVIAKDTMLLGITKKGSIGWALIRTALTGKAMTRGAMTVPEGTSVATTGMGSMPTVMIVSAEMQKAFAEMGSGLTALTELVSTGKAMAETDITTKGLIVLVTVVSITPISLNSYGYGLTKPISNSKTEAIAMLSTMPA